MGAQQSAAFVIRPVRDEDVEALVRLTLAAFEPVFPSFERMLGPAIYGSIWPDGRASQRKAVEMFCRDRDRCSVWVAEVDSAPVGLVACVVDQKERTGEVQFLVVAPRTRTVG